MRSNRTTRMNRSIGVAVAIGLVAVLAACAPTPDAAPSHSTPQSTEVNPAGDIPDNQVYVAFTASSGVYRIKVPEGWSRTSSGPSTSFTDKLNSIKTEQSAVPAAPSVDSVKQTVVPALAASRKQFTPGDVKPFQRGGGTGIELTYQDESAANSVTGTSVREDVQLFLFWKNGQQVALTLASPHGADNVDPWNIVTKSFTWLR